METIQILGDIMDDNAIRKIEAYWEEHQEEYAQLNTEKNNCQNAIREIQSRADKVNADDEIKPLEKEIRTLENEKNLFGAKELTDLGNIVAELKKERANLGIFKFAMRKEATQKINEAEANYSAKQRVITSEKNKIQGEINKLQSKIKTYENQVQKEKSKILEECVPHQARIEQIDRELTKKR